MTEQTDIAFEEDGIDQAWLCVCGHYEESGLHCSYCGAEPPWGCDCSDHDEEFEDEEESWGWIGP